MRLITSRVYRAFPELDRYPDDRCIRFVNAAKRGLFRRALHVILIGPVAIATGCGLFAGILYLIDWIWPDSLLRAETQTLPWLTILFILFILMCGALGAAAGFVVRDVLLRRRVRYVLRTRGVCASCRYGLVGLPVESGNVVVCPECGFETEVDESLGELVLDATGRNRYEPNIQPVRQSRIFTQKRMEVMKRVAKYGGLGLLVLIPSLWGAWELYIRAQAKEAAAARNGLATLSRHLESVQPESTDGADAWTHFGRANALILTTDDRVYKAPPDGSTKFEDIYPYFSTVYDPQKLYDDATKTQKEKAALELELSILLLDAYRVDGVYAELDKLAATPRALRALNASPTQPLSMMLLPELGRARQFARINAARMHLSSEAGNLAEFESAMRVSLALGSMTRRGATLVDGLVGVAIDALAIERMRSALVRHGSDPNWTNAMKRALKDYSINLDATHVLEGERICIQDTIAWIFSDPANIRRGKFSSTMKSFTSGEAVAGRMGSFADNRDEFDAYFGAIKAEASMERTARVKTAAEDYESELVLVNIMMPAISKTLTSYDQLNMDRRSMSVMLALEEFRQRTGSYPATLPELVPGHLDMLPTDPFTGRLFGYKRIDAATDTQQRGYLLYSFGSDGVDDGGATPADIAPNMSVLTSSDPVRWAGQDFVINDDRR